jgi:uncharacterized membrane protein
VSIAARKTESEYSKLRSNSVMAHTSVRLAFAVAIGLAAGPALAQEADVPSDTLIRLQRTSCYGPCPIYTVTIDAGGTVTYEGERSVRVVGRRTAQIETSTIARIAGEGRKNSFLPNARRLSRD